MLDIQYIRDHVQNVRTACQNKELDEIVVDQLIEVDENRRQKIGQVEKIRAEINANSDQIKNAVSQGQQPDLELIEKGRQLKTELKVVEPQLKELEFEFDKLMYQIPNPPATEVPIGPDETGNQVVRQEGQLPRFDFEPKHHHQLMEDLDLLDIKRAVRIGGFRSYFLKNGAVKLEQALLGYALDQLIDEGFNPMTVPVMVNEDAMWGTGYFPWGEEDHYRTQDGQFLTGTAEVALTAYHQGETLTEKDLPLKICGISPCFRREVGAHGQDTRGIIRVHQFNKVEQVVYTVADEAETQSWHETMLGLSERLLQDLKLPYQVLLMCTGDMGAGQRKKYDIETWFPAQDKYRETHSASYFNDFQSRRLNIRYQAKDGTLKHVYTLNNTMAASPRLLAAVIENYQQIDGSIEIPEVLRDRMGGKVRLEK